jgi:hypothetical protein
VLFCGASETPDLAPDDSLLLPGLPKIILCLLGYPAFGGPAEGYGQTDRHFGRYPTVAIDQVGQRRPGHAKAFCSLSDGKAKGSNAEFPDSFTGMWWIMHNHVLLL